MITNRQSNSENMGFYTKLGSQGSNVAGHVVIEEERLSCKRMLCYDELLTFKLMGH